MITQTTIERSFTCSGIGLHSGKQVCVRVFPGKADTGIIFEILTAEGPRRVKLSPGAVVATGLATTLAEPARGKHQAAKVSTVEHLLATVRGLALDNLLIQVEGGELPILDGSAGAWLQLFSGAGVKKLKAPRRVFLLARPFELHDQEKYIRAYPYNGFRVDYTIEFPHKAIGRQSFSLELTPETFTQVAHARTFGFLRDVEYMHANGLALGGSLANAIVLDDNAVVNPEGLRYTDEFVRHKVLDFIGDMAMLSLPLMGRFEVFCSGHKLNNMLLRALESEGLLSAQRVQNFNHAPKAPKNSLVVGGKLVAA